MPFAEIVDQTSEQNRQLQHDLESEWRNPTEDPGAPTIIFESDPIRPQLTPQHVYIVWDAWAPLTQQERTRMILRTYAAIRGPGAAREVTIAMGITKAEAANLGLRFQNIPAPQNP